MRFDVIGGNMETFNVTGLQPDTQYSVQVFVCSRTHFSPAFVLARLPTPRALLFLGEIGRLQKKECTSFPLKWQNFGSERRREDFIARRIEILNESFDIHCNTADQDPSSLAFFLVHIC
jgi:hypothetical protein